MRPWAALGSSAMVGGGGKNNGKSAAVQFFLALDLMAANNHRN